MKRSTSTQNRARPGTIRPPHVQVPAPQGTRLGRVLDTITGTRQGGGRRG
ncbi:hypothetical protein [Streptomyces xiamenensis]